MCLFLIRIRLIRDDFFCLGDALIDLDAGHVHRHDDRPSLNFFGLSRALSSPLCPFFYHQTLFDRVRKEDSTNN